VEKITLKTPLRRFGKIDTIYYRRGNARKRVYKHRWRREEEIFMTADGEYIIMRAKIDDNNDITA